MEKTAETRLLAWEVAIEDQELEVSDAGRSRGWTWTRPGGYEWDQEP